MAQDTPLCNGTSGLGGSYANPSCLTNGTAPLLGGFYSDPLTYSLNGNMPPGEAYFNPYSNSTGSGQLYRGEGASLTNSSVAFTGFNVDGVYTNSTVCTNMFANLYTSSVPLCNGTNPVNGTGCYQTQQTSVQIGGNAAAQSLYCCAGYKGVINGTTGNTTWSSSSYSYCSAGNWSNLEAYLLDENLNYNTTYANANGSGINGTVSGTGADQGQAQQCMGCHLHNLNGAYWGPAYLLSGHKNALRKVIPGTPLSGPSGVPYPDINWTSGQQYSTGAQAYYILGGWQDSSEVVFAQSSPGLSVGYCARCHTTGWNPVAPFTDTTSITNGYTYGNGSLLNTQTGPEPSVAALNGTVLFNGSLLYSTTSNGTTSYYGYQNSPGVPAFGYTALANGVLNTSPYSEFGPAGTVSASWYLNGVTCERCHNPDIGNQAVAKTGEHASGHDDSSTTSSISTSATNPIGWNNAPPPIPTGMNSLVLCMQCHREESVNPTNGTITLNWGVVVAKDNGSCADGSGDPYAQCIADGSTWNFVPTIYDGEGTELLASPHAKYDGVAPWMNNQVTADLSIANGTINNAANFLTINVNGSTAANGTVTGYYGTKGCTGCHDAHFTTVNVPNVPTNPSWGILYSDAGMTTANAPLSQGGAQVEMPALVSAGAQSHNCNDVACHGGSMQNSGGFQFNHSTGPGTPFPTGTSADFPGACFTCHMQGSSGVAQVHFFRINPSATYYTYPSAAMYYSNSTALLTDTTAFVLYAPSFAANGTIVNGTILSNGTYYLYSGGAVVANGTSYGIPSSIMINQNGTNAYLATGYPIASDVDIACGQCHGGGGPTDSRQDTNPPYTNPYGIPTTGAPYFQRPYLASIAVNIHGTVLGTQLNAPTFNPNGGNFSAPVQVTLNDTLPSGDAGPATICYTTNGYVPTANTPGTCDTQPLGGPPGTEYSTSPGSSIWVSQSETVTAIATQASYVNSVYNSALFTIGPAAQVATPSFSMATGTYYLNSSTSTLTDLLLDATSGATICYTTNGTIPAATNGTCNVGNPVSSGYQLTIPTSGAPLVNGTETVEALGTLANELNSPVFSAAYTLVPAAPTFNPGTETFYQAWNPNSWPMVTTTSNTGATLLYCYTVAGQAPCTPNTTGMGNGGPPWEAGCASGSPPCATTFYVDAAFPGGPVSAVSSATYTIKPGDGPTTPRAATPTYTPAGGRVTQAKAEQILVVISDASSGASICYTLNGPVPQVNPKAAGSCNIGTLYTSGTTGFPLVTPVAATGAITVSGTTATVPSTVNPAVGATVYLAGWTPVGYNGTFTVLTTSSTSFTMTEVLAGYGAMTQNSAILTDSSGPFTSSMVGDAITVSGAGAGGGPLNTTIASYQSATQVTLSTAASTAVSSAPITIMPTGGTTGTVGTVSYAPEGTFYTFRAAAGGPGYLQSEPIAKWDYILR